MLDFKDDKFFINSEPKFGKVIYNKIFSQIFLSKI